MNITTVGIDLAKDIITVYAQDKSGHWFYPDLTDTSLRVIIHSEVGNAKAKKIQSGI